MCHPFLSNRCRPIRSLRAVISQVALPFERNSEAFISQPRAKRGPITPDILLKIHSLWCIKPPSFDRTMLWAAFCLGFFGFLRSGEFTCSSPHNHSECTLTVGDVAIDSRQDPRVLTVSLRNSKTDQFGMGTHIYLGRTGNELCPVSAVLAYLAIRQPAPGPLFIFEDGTPLTRRQLITRLHEALSQVGIDVNNVSGHSFRIGAASTAAKAGFSDSFIQTLGRWKSSAFTAYIRTPIENLITASASLSSPGHNHATETVHT